MVKKNAVLRCELPPVIKLNKEIAMINIINIKENTVQGCKLQKSPNFSQDEELYIATSDTKRKMENDYKPFIDKVLNGISFIPRSILDLGCGPGYIARRFNEVLPNTYIAGVDISRAMITHAVKIFKKSLMNKNLCIQKYVEGYSGFYEKIAYTYNYNDYGNLTGIPDAGYLSDKLEYIVADSSNLPFRDNFFDLVVLKGTFKCLENKARSLNEIYRVLSEKGEILIYEFRKEIPEDEFKMLTKDMPAHKANALRNKLNCSLGISEYENYLRKTNLINFTDISMDGLDIKIKIIK